MNVKSPKTWPPIEVRGRSEMAETWSVCVCVYVCMCMYVYIYTRTYLHTCIHIIYIYTHRHHKNMDPNRSSRMIRDGRYYILYIYTHPHTQITKTWPPIGVPGQSEMAETWSVCIHVCILYVCMYAHYMYVFVCMCICMYAH
jgi:hypothetical protein